jgi:hypothetical protein
VTRFAAAIAVAIAAFLASTPAVAQSSPSRPGSYVIDIRAPMSGLPSTSAFHPALPADALVPKRGFGLGLGGHIYVASLGVATIGLGIDVLRVRGTAATPAAATTMTTPTTTTTSSTSTAMPTSALSTVDPVEVATTMTAIAPQLSFNFGTREGWSYLSGGYGAAEVRTAASGTSLDLLPGKVMLVRDDGRAAAINYGGGARWFIRDRVAVGFDLRFHRLAAIGTRPSTKFSVVSVGLSVR